MSGDVALHALDLCAGYGGFSLALRVAGLPARTVCYVQREAFAAACLVKEMGQGLLDEAPVWSDLATFDGRRWRGAVDLVTAGFPCQPFSQAGKRLGHEDARYHGVWPHIARIVGECQPALVFLENVTLDAFRGPRADLEALGYRVPPAVRVSAGDVGAPHDRDRWWLLAHAVGSRLEVWQSQPSDARAEQPAAERGVARSLWDRDPSSFLGLPDGSPSRVDRLHAIGNGIVPLAGAVALDVLLAQVSDGGHTPRAASTAAL